METNAQNTVVIIFQHVEIFFSMLDHYADRSSNSIGFKIAAYDTVLHHYVNTSIQDKNDRLRIKTALSINNLQECGLVSFINDNRGLFGLQRGLIQTIQCLDSKRIRELGQPDLDIIYAQTKSLYDYFVPKGRAHDPHDQEFKENLAALMDTLQDVLGKIDHNVRALEGSSKRLSEILDSHDFSKLIVTDQVRNALDEIIRISRRNIQPTLTFLNEKAMAQDASAMRLLRQIRESFEKTTLYSEHANISAIEMKLLSYSEVVKEIRKRLYHYVEMDKKQRDLYNAIETQFNILHQNAIARLDSKLKGKQIPPDDPFFNPSKQFRGLNNWSRSNLTGALIEQPDGINSSHVEEYIRTRLNRADALTTPKRQPKRREGTTAKTRKRVLKIKKAMASFDACSAERDIYSAIHTHLNQLLEDHELRDIYDAIPFIRANGNITQTLDRKELQYKNKKLTYMAKQLKVPPHG